MPRSRSWSLESMTRSTTAWWAANDAGGAQQRVDERGLAVVDVRDEGDVAERESDARSGGGRAALRRAPGT